MNNQNQLQANHAAWLDEQIDKGVGRLFGLGRTAIEEAIQIGGWLNERKASLPHGQWLPYLAQRRLPARTAANWMGLHANKEKIKLENFSNLTEAYAFISDAKQEERTIVRDKLGFPVPEHLVDAWNQNFELKLLVDDMKAFEEKFKTSCKAKLVRTYSSSRSLFDEAFKQISFGATSFRMAMFHCVCPECEGEIERMQTCKLCQAQGLIRKKDWNALRDNAKELHLSKIKKEQP